MRLLSRVCKIIGQILVDSRIKTDIIRVGIGDKNV
jgi:hypothetical protein